MLYLVNADGSGLKRLTEGDVGGEVAPSWSPDGETIAFQRLGVGDDNVHAISVDGSSERLLLRHAGHPAWSPDGSKIAFAERPFGEAIAVFDLQTKRIRRMVRSKLSFASDLAWSPDGTRIAFSSGIFGSSEIYIVNVDGTGLRRLTKNREVIDHSPTWMTSGRIIFASDRAGRMQLYVMKSNGTGVRRFR